MTLTLHIRISDSYLQLFNIYWDRLVEEFWSLLYGYRGQLRITPLRRTTKQAYPIAELGSARLLN